MIAGQHPNVRRARKSIASFKLREGMPVGVSVTLRRARMWEFLDRLVSIAVPRIRDFRGLNPRSFDGRGNYSMGVKEQLIFPEIDYDSIDVVRGLDVTITTSAKTDLEAFELLLGLGMPFAQEGRPGQADARSERKAKPKRSSAKRRPARRLKSSRRRWSSSKRRTRRPTPSRKARTRARAEGGDEEAGETADRRVQTMAKTSHEGEAGPQTRSSSRAATTAAAAAGARVPTTANSASAGSACARPRTRGTSPE